MSDLKELELPVDLCRDFVKLYRSGKRQGGIENVRNSNDVLSRMFQYCGGVLEQAEAAENEANPFIALRNAIRAGNYNKFAVGSIIPDTWTDITTGVVHDMPMVVMSYNDIETPNGQCRAVILARKYPMLSVAFSQRGCLDYFQSDIADWLDSGYAEGCSEQLKMAVQETIIQSSDDVSKTWIIDVCVLPSVYAKNEIQRRTVKHFLPSIYNLFRHNGGQRSILYRCQYMNDSFRMTDEVLPQSWEFALTDQNDWNDQNARAMIACDENGIPRPYLTRSSWYEGLEPQGVYMIDKDGRKCPVADLETIDNWCWILPACVIY